MSKKVNRLAVLTEAWQALSEEERAWARTEWLRKMKEDAAFTFTADVLLALQDENERLRGLLRRVASGAETAVIETALLQEITDEL